MRCDRDGRQPEQLYVTHYVYMQMASDLSCMEEYGAWDVRECTEPEGSDSEDERVVGWSAVIHRSDACMGMRVEVYLQVAHTMGATRIDVATWAEDRAIQEYQDSLIDVPIRGALRVLMCRWASDPLV